MAALSLSRSVTVLGSTGSIGVSTLDLLDAARSCGSAEVQVVALTAGRNVERLAEQALYWRPQLAVIEDESRL
jgi:1-deoxy-D-xylulose-5-phosphate reductoisomerase